MYISDFLYLHWFSRLVLGYDDGNRCLYLILKSIEGSCQPKPPLLHLSNWIYGFFWKILLIKWIESCLKGIFLDRKGSQKQSIPNISLGKPIANQFHVLIFILDCIYTLHGEIYPRWFCPNLCFEWTLLHFKVDEIAQMLLVMRQNPYILKNEFSSGLVNDTPSIFCKFHPNSRI